MRAISRSLVGLAAVAISFGAVAARAESLEGRWDASLTLNGTAIPFRLDLSGEGKNLVGTLYNGEQKQTTTSAQTESGAITLAFDHYLTKIVASARRLRPSFLAASRSATTTAWAVGSFDSWTLSWARATIASLTTATAPMGALP